MKTKKLLALLIAISMTIGLATVPAKSADVTDGLVVQWNFEDNLNDTIGGNVGTPLPAASDITYIKGVSGKALSLAGKGYISVPDSASLNLSKNYTISYWSYANDTKDSYVCAKTLTPDSSYYAYCSLFKDKPEYEHRYVYDAENEDDETRHTVYGNSYVEIKKWNLTTIVCSDADVKVYVNSQLRQTDPLPSDFIKPVLSTGSLYLGLAYDGATFNGSIDDFRIYNRALSADDVTAMYDTFSSTLKPKDALVAHYTFEKDASDASEFGNNGTIINSAEGITYEKGKVGNCAKFNGSSYIEVPFADSLNFDKAFTICSWIKPAGVKDSSLASFPLFCKTGRNGETSSTSLELFTNANGLFSYFDKTFTDNTLLYFYAPYSDKIKKITNDSWYHLAITYDGKKVTQYFNGAMIQTDELVDAEVENSSAISLIGKSVQDEFLKGSLDELRIYNYAVASGDIYKIYQTVDSSDVVVDEKLPTKVTLNKKKATLKVGKTLKLKAKISPATGLTTANKKLTWKTSNKKVATVSNGKVKAKKKGKATITVRTVNGKAAKCRITVIKKKK